VIAAIHQPNYIPWLGYFYKIHACDVFVFLDNVPLSQGSFVNRNKVKTSQGETWLTVPYFKKRKWGQLISEVDINNSEDWRTKHWKTIEQNYRKAPFFKQYYNVFDGLYTQEWNSLIDLNEHIVKLLCSLLGLQREFIRASSLGICGSSTHLLVNICRAVGADTYISGFGGSKYQDENLFIESGVALKYYEFKHPVYPQLWNGFIPNMSVIDLLLNCGPKSMDIILRER
jgi:hypothetical protein